MTGLLSAEQSRVLISVPWGVAVLEHNRHSATCWLSAGSSDYDACERTLCGDNDFDDDDKRVL